MCMTVFQRSGGRIRQISEFKVSLVNDHTVKASFKHKERKGEWVRKKYPVGGGEPI